MIDFDFTKECCGCGACVDTCPKACIKLKCSPYGYKIPEVNTDVCIGCNRCDKVCPVLNTPRRTGYEHKVYSAYNKNPNLRDAGSSGSVFYLFATSIINKGGVVYGAAFDDHLQLRHTKAYDDESLKPLLKSKYIQSNTCGVYNNVKQDLIDGRSVLFVGTPCQTNALFNYIPSKYKGNLYIIDFICHGVPGQELFDKSIKYYEKRNKCHVENFTFRVKGKKHSKYYNIDYTCKDGHKEKETGKFSDNPYYRGYMLYHCFRQSCYRCKHLGTDRISDLTIADFWGITKVNPKVTDIEKGYSMVIANSDKGQYLLEQIKDNIYIDEYSINDAIINNSAYTKTTQDTIISRLFRFSFKYLPYNVTEKVFMSHLLSIGIRITRKVRYANFANRILKKCLKI